MSKQIVLSHEGLRKLQDELEFLKTTKRKEIAQAIQKARSFGDLSENSEYDEAKNDQAEIETRIAHLEQMLKFARVLDDKDLGTDKVNIGNKVVVHDIDTDEEMEYKIVSSAEVDPLLLHVSDESPIGKALLGQKIGDSVIVETPSGDKNFTISAISK